MAEVDVCLVVSEASLNVGDCTVGCVNLLCHTGGAVSAGANFLREGLALAGPLAVRSGSQELLEVVGGAGLVRAEEHLDRQIRQGCVRVGLSQSRVVPVGDGALEDVNDVVNGQVQLINTVDVVSNCNRADDERQVPGLVSATACSCFLNLLVLQRGVRASELHLVCNEVLLASTGAGRVVCQVGARNFLGVDLAEVVHCLLLGGSSLSNQCTGLAGQYVVASSCGLRALSLGLGSRRLSSGLGSSGVGVVGAVASNEGDRGNCNDASDCGGALDVADHGITFQVIGSSFKENRCGLHAFGTQRLRLLTAAKRRTSWLTEGCVPSEQSVNTHSSRTYPQRIGLFLIHHM